MIRAYLRLSSMSNPVRARLSKEKLLNVPTAEGWIGRIEERSLIPMVYGERDSC